MYNQLFCLDNNYATTKLCYKLLDSKYFNKNGQIKKELKFKINIPKTRIQNSKFIGKHKDKLETYLFLPIGEKRKGEGGLRTKGYFKYSYEIEKNKWYACNFYGQRLFEIEPPKDFDINPLKKFENYGIISLPLISIITVVFNGEKYLEETIQSVINQTYPNVEYIIIDGGSTDGTIDIIKKYENYIDYWISEKDKGIYDAMNKGIDLASGRWINFMNAGDKLYNSHVLTTLFPYNLSSDVLYGNTMLNYKSFKKIVAAAPIKTLNNAMPFSHQSTFVRTEIYKLNKFNSHYRLAADFDFFYSLWKENGIFNFINTTIAETLTNGIADRQRLKVLSEYLHITKNKKIILRMLEESLKFLFKPLVPQKIKKIIILNIKK